MSSVIRIKRSSTPGSIPSGLSTGELAINLIDGKLYVGANSSTTRLVGGVQLANTNLAIARINTNLTGTNTAIRLLVADRLQVANAVATYATKVNPTTSGLLAHTGRATISTNLAVSGNTTLSGLIANGSLGSSNYTLRTNGTSVYWAPGGGSTTKYLEVANAVVTFQTIATERAALANTNTFIATKVNTTTFNSALANTNSFIATKVNTTTFNSALANTNSFIAANALVERQHLANTNTFIATKVNTTTFNSALANTNTFIATKVNTTTFNSALANTNSYIAAGDLLERQHLANTNTFIATKVNTTTFNSALANTNAFIKAQLANTNVFIGTKVSTSTFNAALANTNTNYATKVYVNAAVDALVNAAPTLLNTLKELSSAIGDDANFAATIATSLGAKASNTYVKTLLANTNAYIATKVNTTTFNSAVANTNSYIAANALIERQHLANTNASITNVKSGLTATNTAIRLLVADRLQVANAAATYQTKATERAALANTNAFIAANALVERQHLANTNSFIAANALIERQHLANTNAYIASVVSGGITKYLEVANAVAIYQTKATERAALANTNAFIATKVNTTTFNSALANTNTFIATKVNTTTFNSALANTNAFIKAQLANTNVFIGTKVSTSTFNSALANTNANYATKVYVNAAVDALVNAAPTLLNTLKELSSAIGDDANFASTIATNLGTKASNTYVKTLLANTNTFIATKVNTTTFNSALANTNSFIAANALIERQHLANTNARVTLVNTNLTGTNTAIRTLVADRLQVANAAATYQTIATERAALANTNSFIAANALVERQHLANTNARVTLVNTNLTGTNTAIRLLVADRLQVANAAATYQTKATERAALANTNSFIAANALIERQHLANTNTFIATKVNTTTFNSALANTNAFIKAQLANTNVSIATKVSTTTFNAALANTNANYATKVYVNAAVDALVNAAPTLLNTLKELSTAIGDDANFASTIAVNLGTKASNTYVKTLLANTNAFIKAQLANTNAYINTKANATNPTTSGVLAHTGRATISTNLTVSGNTVISALVAGGTRGTTNQVLRSNGTTAFWSPGQSANVIVSTSLVSALTQNDTVVTSLTDISHAYTLTDQAVLNGYLQVANAVSTYQTKATERAALANTNAFIKAQLANTNASIATKVSTTTFNSALANTNTFIATKVNTTTFNSALANTNTYIATKLSNAWSTTVQTQDLIPATTNTYSLGSPTRKYKDLHLSGATMYLGNTVLSSTRKGTLTIAGQNQAAQTLVSNAYLTSTFIANTTARTLIADRLQVANAAATYQTKATERAALANTNASITNVKSGLTATNTAIRTLVADRLQVSNAVATYATKVNPTTSGLLAHTGRATISTNLTVSGNTNVSGNMIIDGNLDVNGSLTYINSTTVTVGDNMIKLANTNRSDVIDTGVYSRYTSSGTKYTGVIRDATDGVYKFFYNLSTEPNQTIDFGTSEIATIEAVIDGGQY